MERASPLDRDLTSVDRARVSPGKFTSWLAEISAAAGEISASPDVKFPCETLDRSAAGAVLARKISGGHGPGNK